MLRGPTGLLLRIAQRAPLARAALPLLTAYAPEAFRLRIACVRSLHVFARRHSTDYAKVEVHDGADAGDLKRAVIAELQLGVPPDSVRLLREVAGGGAPVPLDSRRKLADQLVTAGTSLIIEVLAPAATAFQPLLNLDAKPAASLHLEYRGLSRSAQLTLFSLAVRSAQVGPLCAASGTRMWRLANPAAPSEALTWPLLRASALVERDFYARFLTEGQWLGDFSGAQRRMAVLGQPGIGKSSFGLWLLAQLLRSDRTVVYSRNSSMPRSPPIVVHYAFHGGVAFETATSDLGAVAALLAEPSVVHISDGLPPRLPDLCHKVLISPPDPCVWRWFVEKEHASTAYFPLYDYAELEALREAEFGAALPPETLKLRAKAWGLTPRAVFSPNQRELGKAIVKALHGRSLEDLQRYMGEVGAPTGAAAGDDTPHTLFTLQADRETLTEGEVTFRSDAVAQRVARQVAQTSRDALQRLWGAAGAATAQRGPS